MGNRPGRDNFSEDWANNLGSNVAALVCESKGKIVLIEECGSLI